MLACQSNDISDLFALERERHSDGRLTDSIPLTIKMNQSMFKCLCQCAILILALLALVELALAIWTVVEPRYKSLAYNLADVGYIVSSPMNSSIDRLNIFLFFRICGFYDICPCVYSWHRSSV